MPGSCPDHYKLIYAHALLISLLMEPLVPLVPYGLIMIYTEHNFVIYYSMIMIIPNLYYVKLFSTSCTLVIKYIIFRCGYN